MRDIRRVSQAEASDLSGHLKDAWNHTMSTLHTPKPTDHEFFQMSVYVLKQNTIGVIDICNCD